LLSNAEIATLTGQAVIDALGYAPSKQQDIIDYAEPLNVPPIADDKVAVFNADGSKRYEDYGGGSSGGATPITKPFTYTGGLQEFTVDTPIIEPSYILVGNTSLQRTQYTWSGSKFTITDTLTNGAVIEIGYWDDTAIINSIAPDGLIESGNLEAVSGDKINNSLHEKAKLDVGVNKFDNTRFTPLSYTSINGTITSNSNYNVSHYIPILPNSNYKKQDGEYMHWYDENLNFISTITYGDLVITSPSTAVWCKVSVYIGKMDIFMFCLESEYPAEYKEYKTYLSKSNYPLELLKGIGNIKTPLEYEDELDSVDGTLLNGVLGINPSIEIPFTFRKPTVIEFDFNFSKDIHSGFGKEVFACISNEILYPAIPFFKFGVESIIPTKDIYTSTYNSRFFVSWNGNDFYSDDFDGINFTNHLNGVDSFSVRKTTPILADIDIEIEVTTTQVRIFDSGGNIGLWTFAMYPLLDDLLTQMQTDLGSVYEVVKYYTKGVNSNELAYFKAFLCKSQEGYTVETSTLNGTTIYDSYETFMPLIDTVKYHNIKIAITQREGVSIHVDLLIYINDLKVFSNYFFSGTLEDDDMNFYFNYAPDLVDTYFDGDIKNLKITRTEQIEKYRSLTIMSHNMIDGEEDNTTPIYTITSGRINRFITRAKINGWKFISIDKFSKMNLGEIPKEDKVIIWTTDDSKFDWDTVEGVRQVFRKQNITQTTALITQSFDFATNKNLVDKIYKYGNNICLHCHYHNRYEYLSYAQFINAFNTSLTLLRDNYLGTNVIIYSNSSNTKSQGIYYKNNGFILGFVTSGGIEEFGKDLFRIKRQNIDDAVDFSTIETLLNI